MAQPFPFLLSSCHKCLTAGWSWSTHINVLRKDKRIRHSDPYIVEPENQSQNLLTSCFLDHKYVPTGFSRSLERLLEMQKLRPHPRTTESETAHY